MKRVLPYTHFLLEEVLEKGDIAIDCTAGNGHDTKFLAEAVGPTGKVFAFDIQQSALENTKKRLQEADILKQVELIHDSHSSLLTHLPKEMYGKVKAAVFNLGYLPGGDKSIVTTAPSTVEAIEQLLKVMCPQAIIALVVYHGHPEGQIEREAVLQYVRELDQKSFSVLQYQFLNQKNNPPFLIAIQKK